ncbi:hypothetical protein DPMN_152460 [Dreissena polymorpha]|uniref:Uncharacterized protein n=1 Tax=Dreissena polymorpha TaxID=45954 RepID=A0A9D4FN21_DREPO|nr:hypothetical protein DPMN_152460 [Dreissena polymorpha]
MCKGQTASAIGDNLPQRQEPKSKGNERNDSEAVFTYKHPTRHTRQKIVVIKLTKVNRWSIDNVKAVATEDGTMAEVTSETSHNENKGNYSNNAGRPYRETSYRRHKVA